MKVCTTSCSKLRMKVCTTSCSFEPTSGGNLFLVGLQVVRPMLVYLGRRAQGIVDQLISGDQVISSAK